jgi:hypothetical protein
MAGDLWKPEHYKEEGCERFRDSLTPRVGSPKLSQVIVKRILFLHHQDPLDDRLARTGTITWGASEPGDYGAQVVAPACGSNGGY